MKRRLALLVPTVFASCAVSDHVGIARQRIEPFHSLFNSAEIEKIWYQATTEFQNKFPREDFVRLLLFARSRLGGVLSTREETWRAGYVSGRVLVNLTHRTTFDKGEAQELFGYRIDGNSAFLFAYFMESPVFDGYEHFRGNRSLQ